MNHIMVMILTGALLLAALFLCFSQITRKGVCEFFVNAISVINITPKGRGTALSASTLTRRYLLVKQGADPEHIDICGVNDTPFAVCPDMTPTTDTDTSYPLPYNILGLDEDTERMVVNSATNMGDLLVPAGNGLVQTLPATAGTYWVVGRGKTATAAQYDLVEVAPCFPYQVTVGLATGGAAGYAAGAGNGGTVTQITSSATGVTVNTLTGQITTVALTTAAAANERFTVTNSAVAAKDTIALSTTYAGAGTPLLSVTKVAAGAFDVIIYNAHATAAFNALMILNFTVNKGATT